MLGIQHPEDPLEVSVDTQGVYPDLAAGISSQYGPVMNERHFQTLLRRCNGAGTAGDAASHHYVVKVQRLFRCVLLVGARFSPSGQFGTTVWRSGVFRTEIDRIAPSVESGEIDQFKRSEEHPSEIQSLMR